MVVRGCHVKRRGTEGNIDFSVSSQKKKWKKKSERHNSPGCVLPLNKTNTKTNTRPTVLFTQHKLDMKVKGETEG